MLKYLLLLFLSFPVYADLVTGKDGGVEYPLNINSAGQVSHTLPAFDTEEVAAGVTDQTLGGNGEIGEYLDHCICQVITSGATGICGIEDGSNTNFDNITVVGASAPLGVYTIDVRSEATTSAGWEVTTGAGATMQCYGYFD